MSGESMFIDFEECDVDIVEIFEFGGCVINIGIYFVLVL